MDQVIITLIHGTFQPNASWTAPDSALCKHLSSSVPGAIIQTFQWSAINAHCERLSAAEGLRKHIAGLRLAFPNAHQILIGHSHGGTVIHYAFADLEFDRSVAGAVFLSTPFLQFRSYQRASSDTLVMAMAVLLDVIPSYAMFLLMHVNPILVALILLPPVALIAQFMRHKFQIWRRRAEGVLANLPMPPCNSARALLIRAEGDEVSGGMSAAYMLSWLRVRATERAEKRFADLERRKPVRPEIDLLTAVPPMLMAYLASLWAACMTVACFVAMKKAFGSDLARDSLFIQIAPEPTPPGKWTVVQLSKPEESTVAPAGESELAHSSYGHPETPSVIREWICSLCMGRNDAVN